MKAKVIAVANLKGGVGKTTTALSFGAELSMRGHKVLLVDADDNNQSLTAMLKAPDDPKRKTLANLLVQSGFFGDVSREQTRETILSCEEGFDLLPSDLQIAGVSRFLSSESAAGDPKGTGIQYHLKKVLSTVSEGYEFIIIDTSANNNMFFINTLTAADEVIIPAQAQKMSDNGTLSTLDAIVKRKENLNPELTNRGILITMVDNRTRYSKRKAGDIGDMFTRMGLCVFRTTIPRTVKGEEYAESGKSILSYAGGCKAAEAYREFVTEYRGKE